MGDDYIDAEPDEFFSIFFGAIASPVGITKLDLNVPAFRIAERVQAAPECIRKGVRSPCFVSIAKIPKMNKCRVFSCRYRAPRPVKPRTSLHLLVLVLLLLPARWSANEARGRRMGAKRNGDNPIVEPVNLAVDEDDVRPPAFHLIIEVAAIGIDNGHALLAGSNALMSIASLHLVSRVIERHDRVSRSALLRDAREPA
jgi:hypothetical protein